MKYEADGHRVITACDQERGPDMLTVAVPAGVVLPEPEFGDVVELEGEASETVAALETLTLAARTRVQSESAVDPLRERNL